jgi:hypothetical protein
LQGAQQQQQMNALKMQEYQQQQREKNELAQVISSEGFDLNNPAQVQNLLRKAPTLGIPYVKEARMAAVEKAKAEKEGVQTELERFKLRKEQLDFTEKALQNSVNPTLARAHIQQAIALKYVTPEVGAQMLTSVPEDPVAFQAWRTELLTQSMTAKDQLEAVRTEKKETRERAEKSYPAYQLAEFEAGREPLPLDQYVAQRMQTTAAPTTVAPAAAAPAPEFLGAEGAEGVVTKSPDGSVNLPPVTKSAGKMPSAFDSNIHPLVPSLIAGGNVEAAKLVQKAHETTGTFRQIQDTLKELDRLETEKPKGWEARTKVLRDYLKTASTEGPGTKFNLGGITLSTEKKYGEAFAGKVADKDVELKDAAERAPEAANTANRVLGLLSSGQVITGAGANIKLQLAKWLRVAGGNENETIANTEALLSSLADTTLGSIKSSGLGSGQGFTDKDREFLERAKAGQITYDARSLKDLAELAHRAAEATTNKWNKRSKAIPKSAIEGTGISTEDIKVSPIYKSGGSDKTPLTNSKGWKLQRYKDGNTAYVSPDGKQFEEVK